jgi:hypothetical protein
MVRVSLFLCWEGLAGSKHHTSGPQLALDSCHRSARALKHSRSFGSGRSRIIKARPAEILFKQGEEVGRIIHGSD